MQNLLDGSLETLGDFGIGTSTDLPDTGQSMTNLEAQDREALAEIFYKDALPHIEKVIVAGQVNWGDQERIKVAVWRGIYAGLESLLEDLVVVNEAAYRQGVKDGATEVAKEFRFLKWNPTVIRLTEDLTDPVSADKLLSA